MTRLKLCALSAAPIAAGLLAVWLGLTRVAAADLPPLHTGDLVFQNMGGPQGAAITLASDSVYTHVGLIDVDDKGRARVVEAVGPVRTTPLSAWIGQGLGGRITVKRMAGLSARQAKQAIAAAHVYDGRPYDFYFYKGRDEIYCSELVYLAFKEGPGLAIGSVQHVRDLNLDNAPARALIEARWRDYPGCIEAKAADLKACTKIIMDETLVTPASLARDPKLTMIYTNFGAAAE